MDDDESVIAAVAAAIARTLLGEDEGTPLTEEEALALAGERFGQALQPPFVAE